MSIVWPLSKVINPLCSRPVHSDPNSLTSWDMWKNNFSAVKNGWQIMAVSSFSSVLNKTSVPMHIHAIIKPTNHVPESQINQFINSRSLRSRASAYVRIKHQNGESISHYDMIICLSMSETWLTGIFMGKTWNELSSWTLKKHQALNPLTCTWMFWCIVLLIHYLLTA